MAWVAELFAVPPRDSAFGTLRGSVGPFDRRRTWAILGALVLLWFLPRAAMSLQLETIAPDSVFYLDLADALARGNEAAALEVYDFNLFPVVLMWLHQLTSSPELVDRWFCVGLSTLTVIPLFAVLRRLFNEQVAVISCVLCGMHPKLIVWSPEILREPLFWLLFLTALYWLVRAINELRWWQFVIAGSATTLALHTRFEGWLLVVPLVWWTASVVWREPAARRAVLAGAALFVLANPCFLLALNFTWLHDQPQWELGNFRRLKYVERWFESFAPDEPALVQRTATAAVASNSPAASSPAGGPAVQVAANQAARLAPWRPNDALAPLSTWETLWHFVRATERGIGPVFLLLIAVGAWQWRHLTFVPGIAAITVLCFADLAGIWIHLWYGRESSSRYAVLVTLLWSPWVTLGLIQVGAWLDALWARRAGYGPPVRIGLAALLVIAVTHCAYPLTKGDDHRRSVADLGRWIEAHYGPRRTIIGPSDLHVLMPYYSRGEYLAPLPSLTAEEYVDFVQQHRAELIILTKHPIDEAWRESLRPLERRLGYREVTGELPEPVRGQYVLLSSHRTRAPVRQAQVRGADER